jgi:hypothetical protein
VVGAGALAVGVLDGQAAIGLQVADKEDVAGFVVFFEERHGQAEAGGQGKMAGQQQHQPQVWITQPPHACWPSTTRPP